MPSTPFQVIIVGDRDNPTITEVNVRSGPNRSYAALFRTIVGTSGLPILEVRADDQNTLFQGRLFQWFRVVFPNNQEGWVRDDLVQISGDGSNFGYGVIAQATDASKVARNLAVGVIAPGQEIGSGVQSTSQPLALASAPTPSATPVVTSAPTPSTPTVAPTSASVPMPFPASTPAVTAIGGDTPDRVRRASFNITGGFEGGGYATYQTYDSGIISYGRFQFTLAAGSFITVINRYIERSNSPAAGELRGYMGRINAKDQGLRQDARLKELCVSAASDAVMQQIQDEVAVEGFYQPVVDLTIMPRGITLPLSYALIFDTAINHGRFNHLIPKTEEVLGVPSKSRLGDNGVNEVQFTTTLANVRRDNLYALAEKLKFPGLKNRGDFWVSIVNAGDWSLQGDAGGAVHFNGKTVQVKNA